MMPNLPAIYQGFVFVRESRGEIAVPAVGGSVFAMIPNINYMGEPEDVGLNGAYETLVVAPPVFTEQPTHFFYVPEGSANAFERDIRFDHRSGAVNTDFNLTFLIDEDMEEPELDPELDPIQDTVISLVGMILERQLKLGREIGDLDELSQCLIRFRAP